MSFFGNLFGGSQSSESLASIINEGALLVDVRSPGEFAGGSAKGAINIPLDNITQQIKKFEGKKNIVVFCRSGNRSGQAKSILEQKGIKNVTNGGTWEQVNKVVSNINK
jgi:rhodanese-related sulfurtransferase